MEIPDGPAWKCCAFCGVGSELALFYEGRSELFSWCAFLGARESQIALFSFSADIEVVVE